MKDVELKLIVELMKNGRRSDRDLAKAIGSSLPAVTRMRDKLEKEGIIKEYTMIPDFRRLGFEIMALTFVGYREEITEEKTKETKEAIQKVERKIPAAILMGMSGASSGYDKLVFVSLHEDYASFMNHLTVLKKLPNVDMQRIEGFLISLDEGHFQPLTFSVIADYLLTRKETKE